MKKDNPNKLATQVHKTQEKINVREYGRLMKKENPEKLATLDIQETRHINVREYINGNEKGQSRKKLATQVIQETRQIRTIQRNWQHRFIRHREKN